MLDGLLPGSLVPCHVHRGDHDRVVLVYVQGVVKHEVTLDAHWNQLAVDPDLDGIIRESSDGHGGLLALLCLVDHLAGAVLQEARYPDHQGGGDGVHVDAPLGDHRVSRPVHDGKDEPVGTLQQGYWDGECIVQDRILISIHIDIDRADGSAL